jgi:Txe/YoeB family toxin of Txe-Axe toxin-antitoxin module
MQQHEETITLYAKYEVHKWFKLMKDLETDPYCICKGEPISDLNRFSYLPRRIQNEHHHVLYGNVCASCLSWDDIIVSRCCCDTWIVYVVDWQEVAEVVPVINEILLQIAHSNAQGMTRPVLGLPEVFMNVEEAVEFIIEHGLDNLSFEDIIQKLVE